jgi:hypothetical protein
MITASIMKDMAVGSDIVYKANAVRAVIRVIDASTGMSSIHRAYVCSRKDSS